MGRLYRRHDQGSWYGDYQTPEGKRRQHSLRTTDKAVARERLRLAEMGATPDSRGKKQRLMDAIDGMILGLHTKAEGTREMYREKGRRLLKTMGNPFVTDVDMAMLDKYIARRRSKEIGHGTASDHTIQKELITVRRALKHAIKQRTLHVMPHWPEFAANYTPKQTWLTVDHFEAVCGELAPDRRLWASIAALGGMRAGEVERLHWTMIDLTAANRIRVPGTKTKKAARPIPIAPSLRARLEEVPAAQRVGKVVAAWGNVRRDLHAAVARANAKREASKTKPDIPKVSPNDLRRTFASWLVQQGVPLLTIAAMMGHSSTRMLEQVYGKLSDANLQDAIGLLPVTHGVTHSVRIVTTPDYTRDDSEDPEED